MRKNFVLDTNVLLHDPRAIFQFADNNVVIPIYVLEEIDQFKKELSERGRNAREVARTLDRFRGEGVHLADGVALDGGGHVRVALGSRESRSALRASQVVDNKILAVALEVRDAAPDAPTIMVTKDVNLRIRADALGLRAEDYDPEQIQIEELYTGQAELDVRGEDVEAIYRDGSVPLRPEWGGHYHANQFVMLRDHDTPTRTALGRFDAKERKITQVRKMRDPVWGIRPRNREQHYALDLLLNDDIKLVTLVGKAGTGKTLLAIAAGLKRTVEDATYTRMLVSRPVMPLGRDIGFLPGDVDEKLNPWMQPIFDNLEFLFSSGTRKG